MIAHTPGGGLHAYFAGTAQASGRLTRHHLDFKARGGYVLAPPSQVNGKPYRLLARHAESSLLNWPAAASLVEPERRSMSRPGQFAPRGLSRLATWVERLREGNRNSGLFWAACRALEAGEPDGLDDIAAAAARAGLDDREILRTIESARRANRHVWHQAEREVTR